MLRIGEASKRVVIAACLFVGASAQALLAQEPVTLRGPRSSAERSSRGPSRRQTEDEFVESRFEAMEQQVAEQAERQAELERRLIETEAELAQEKKAEGEAPKEEKKEEKKEDPLKLGASYKNGLVLESADKAFKVHIGGRTQVDSVWFSDSPAFTGAGGVGDADAVNFRRARLRIDGVFYEVYDFAAEYDFVNNVNDNVGLQPASQFVGNLGNPNVINVSAPTDLWWGVKELPFIGNVRFGNMKEPMGLEHLASSRYLDFMERSFLQDAFFGPFNNGFTPGIMMYNSNEAQNVTWQGGLFKNTQNVFAYGIGDGEMALTGRATFLPFFDDSDGSQRLLHFGFSGSVRDPDEGVVRYRSRGSLRNGPGAFNPVFVETGTFRADQVQMGGVEAALNLGPLLVQAEYYGANNTNARNLAGNVNYGDVFVQGWYVESLYFLTGEYREYDRKGGDFGRKPVSPHENFFWREKDGCRYFGPGAWQLGVRYAKLDLDNSGLDGGTVQDVTVGLNWFWNPNVKWQFNYVLTVRDAPGVPPAAAPQNNGTIHGFGMRFAHDF